MDRGTTCAFPVAAGALTMVWPDGGRAGWSGDPGRFHMDCDEESSE